MFSTDVDLAYRHLPIDPRDLPLVCFTFEGSFYVELSLPFGIMWSTSHCQDVTSLVARDLTRQGLSILNYIDNFGEVSSELTTAADHFSKCPQAPCPFGTPRGYPQSHCLSHHHGLAWIVV